MGSKYTFSSHFVLPRLNITSSFLTFLHPAQWTVQGDGEWNCGQFITLCLCCHLLFTLFPCLHSGSFPWVLHELWQCVSFPPGKFFKNCSSACVFHGVWSFRNRLLLMGLPWDSVLLEKLLLCGFLHRLQCVYLFWCGSSWPPREQPASPWSFLQVT